MMSPNTLAFISKALAFIAKALRVFGWYVFAANFMWALYYAGVIIYQLSTGASVQEVTILRLMLFSMASKLIYDTTKETLK